MITYTSEYFEIGAGDSVVIRHSIHEPALFIGTGEPVADFYRGNFKVYDKRVKRVALSKFSCNTIGDTTTIHCYADSTYPAIELVYDARAETISVMCIDSDYNRIWVRCCAEPEEAVWGGGEQFSHLNLRGRRFPMWTGEPGVGRDMTTRMAIIAEIAGKAGAHETATYYPQPTFISSRHYALHCIIDRYSVLDFTASVFHEFEFWTHEVKLQLFAGSTIPEIVQKLAQYFGHSGHLPEWVYTGAIIGLKRGFPRNLEILKMILQAGIQVSGLWCEDWCGVRETSFGTRLFWNWEWNPHRYPDLPEVIRELQEQGIRFLAYNNPYLCSDGELFKEAAQLGFLAKKQDGSWYTIDFGEFDCGFVDFTNPEARTWYKERIIKKNMLDLGIAGWMADFGEYQPVDMVTASGEDGWALHNRWPVLWAMVNKEAIAERHLEHEILFFMRAGYTGASKYCKLLWAGDQCVDFSRHDGMETAICAALSSGLVGNAVSHSDIGGYTTLYGNVRTEEVFLRWCEMAAFTPVMRTHESNRPDESFQVYQSERALKFFALMTKRYHILVPYLKVLVQEAIERGIPVQRPLFFHYEHDAKTWSIHDEYLYGTDLLVAPVHKSNIARWSVYLPHGETWVHLWTGNEYTGGKYYTVSAPIGFIPVFYKKNSNYIHVFKELAETRYQ